MIANGRRFFASAMTLASQLVVNHVLEGSSVAAMLHGAQGGE